MQKDEIIAAIRTVPVGEHYWIKRHEAEEIISALNDAGFKIIPHCQGISSYEPIGISDADE